jgi:hypothetical protein
MESKKRFDHVLNLKLTSEMVADIDATLLRLKGTLRQSRSEFLRASAEFALASLAEDSHETG